MTTEAQRVALVGEADSYSGPDIARTLAARGHRLVLGDADPDLVVELESAGTDVVNVTGLGHLLDAGASQRMVDAALSEFGRLDAATTSSGVIVTGRFLDSTPEDFHRAVRGCLEVPYHFLRAVIPPMVARRTEDFVYAEAGRKVTPVDHGCQRYQCGRPDAEGP